MKDRSGDHYRTPIPGILSERISLPGRSSFNSARTRAFNSHGYEVCFFIPLSMPRYYPKNVHYPAAVEGNAGGPIGPESVKYFHGAEGDLRRLLVGTASVLAVLEVRFADMVDQWGGLVEKSRNWLKEHAAARDLKVGIEVEERGSSPKKILGDAVTIMMCNRFAVLQSGIQRYFEVADTSRLIVAGVLPAEGNRLEKVDRVIVPRFKQLPGFSDGINPRNIDFVFRQTIEETVGQLKQMVVKALPT